VEDRVSELENKIEIKQKKKTEEILNNLKAVKVICKNSLTLSKDQT
jgi:hypothetical protein